jgi:DNA-binding transcriptional ArsR family regulator
MRTRSRTPVKRRKDALRFAALGDDTRLSLVMRLTEGSSLSITELADGSKLTRQAITKHLHVLRRAGLVRNIRRGRESVFQIDSKSLQSARDTLDRISAQWDSALMRLKAHVED